MKILASFFVLTFLLSSNLSAQQLRQQTPTSDSTSATKKTDSFNRLSFKLYYGIGARVPLSNSFYNLWKDLAIGDAQFDVSDGLGIAISANGSDYLFSYLRADLDLALSKNISIGLFAYPDKYKKTLTFSDKTNNWTGNGSNGLEDHWELRRRLRIATYNFGPNITLKTPINNWDVSLSYLYGWSYLWRSSYEFSYYSQLTGTGDRGYLGLLYVADGNLTKLRFNGKGNFQRIELGFSQIQSEKSEASFTLRIGYQILKMGQISYKVLKYDSEVIQEASSYFDIGDYQVYQVGDSGDLHIDGQPLKLDLSSFYFSLDLRLGDAEE